MPLFALCVPPSPGVVYNTLVPSLGYLGATAFASGVDALTSLQLANQESFYNGKSFFIHIMANSGAAAVAIVLPVS